MTIKNKIHSVFIKEYKGYSKQQIQELFKDAGDKLPSILGILKDKKILKISIAGQETSMEDVADLVSREDKTVDVLDGDNYVFVFVGIVWVGNYILKCYPKYIPDDAEPVNAFKQVAKVVEKYNSTNSDRKSNFDKSILMYTASEIKNKYNLLEIVIFLLEDYHENGIYTNPLDIIEVNGEGDALWDRTVDETYPIISDNRPYYTEIYTHKRINDEDDYFQKLHECVLTEISKMLEEGRLLDVFDNLLPVYLTDIKLEYFDDEQHILDRIEKELARQFNTHKQQVLLAIYSYIKQEPSHNQDERFMLYGSHNFYHIWEKVCADVFESILNMRLEDVARKYGFKICGDKYKALGYSTFADLVPKPYWIPYSAEYDSQISSETLELDLLAIFDYPLNGENKKRYFAVLDAKYYLTELYPELKNQPGIVDIEKEYLYQLVYNDFIDKQTYFNDKKVFDELINCFLMPTAKDKAELVGVACMNLLADVGLKNIKIVKLPANKMYKWYLGNPKEEDEYMEILEALINVPENYEKRLQIS